MEEIYMGKAEALLDEEGKHSGWYKQVVARVEVINDNNRLYPRGVYTDALVELKGAGFPYAGEHPHPQQYRGRDGSIHFRASIPNSAVQFRDAYIDEENRVWAEYQPLDTEMGRQVKAFLDNGLPIGFSNRMTGEIQREKRNGKQIDVAKRLKLFTWDIVLNPSEQKAFGRATLVDSFEEGKYMDFFNWSLQELQTWKKEHKEAAAEEMALCDQVIALKQEAAAAKEKADVLEAEKTAQAEKKAAQKLLLDEIGKLPYEETTKKAIEKKGAELCKTEEVAPFLQREKTFLDALLVEEKLKGLGLATKAGQVKAVVTEGKETSLLDGILEEMDKELLKKDSGFRIDKELRKANHAILDSMLKQLERKKDKHTKAFFDALAQEKKVLLDDNAPMIAETGQFAQSATISLAILRQAWQDVQFLQLCMTEGFQGTTYKMPVEFQSHDIWSEDDFVVGELDSIPTESVQTFLLEFGGQWLKRGFVVTKEAEKELKSGGLRYDIVAANTASIASRFQRVIDRMIATEMLARSDEYNAKQVAEETVAASEVEGLTKGVNAPEDTNATHRVKLLCGNTSPLGADVIVPPIVRPRKAVWLDTFGRKQEEYINAIVVKDSSGKVLTAGSWAAYKGQIVDRAGTAADYAVDYENSCIYFKENVVSTSKLPKVNYCYATNIAFFNIAVPKAMEGFPARYYNGLLELLDRQKAYMGSSPRYVTPDFALGSLNSMALVKQAELFYQRALPNGTSLGGEGYFAKRNGMDLAEHNVPWAAGDSRLLLGKRNAVRIGMGSPYELEGPYPHMAQDGKGYTSAKEYLATQQIAINTPLVIDEKGVQYHPPFRTVKFYQKEQ